jgi:hypothetical protein
MSRSSTVRTRPSGWPARGTWRPCLPSTPVSVAGQWGPVWVAWSRPEVIVVAVRWYLRYGLSYRDVEELLVERGV